MDEGGKPGHGSLFGLSLLTCPDPDALAEALKGARKRQQAFGPVGFNARTELHFNEAQEIPYHLAQSWLSEWHAAGGKAVVLVADDSKGALKKEFGGSFEAHYALAGYLIAQAAQAHPDTKLFVFADDLDTPRAAPFGVSVQQRANEYADREICVGVVKLRSMANDLLQLADIFVGSVLFQARMGETVPPVKSLAWSKHRISKIVANQVDVPLLGCANNEHLRVIAYQPGDAPRTYAKTRMRTK
ncbi:MAG: hypothetical protein QOH16_1965 [Gaiellaceae bacterium]|nr:hypothetical protein [Gaiellaceae bacterium]